jgi:hypothetical protein
VVHWEALSATIPIEGQSAPRIPARDRPPEPNQREECPILPPLSPASLLLHRKWLDDKDGDRLHAKGTDALGKQLSAIDLSAAIFEDVVLDRASAARRCRSRTSATRRSPTATSRALIWSGELHDLDPRWWMLLIPSNEIDSRHLRGGSGAHLIRSNDIGPVESRTSDGNDRRHRISW